MKKFTLLSMACICLSSISFSQVNKGSVLLGGGISLYSQNSESGTFENKSRGFAVYPSIGLVTKENIVVGFRGNYGYSKSDYNSTPPQEQKDNSYGVGIFLRKYKPLGKSFFIFGEGGAGYNHRKNTQTSIPSKAILKENSFSINLYPGIAYAVSKRIHLEASINNLINLSYFSSRTENQSTSGSSISKNSGVYFSSNANASVPLTIGFRFVLGK